jgi:AcrR family transcriptional regulator
MSRRTAPSASAQRRTVRSGTPAAGRSRPPRSTRAAPLTRERIIAEALVLVERHGLAGFSIRGLGAALHCEAMSLYHYFPSKAHLQDALVDHALADVVTEPPGSDPIDRLRVLSYSYRAMAQRYPKLYQLVAIHRLNTPTGVRVIERVLQLVRDAAPDDRLAAQYFRVLGYYLTGAALDETAGYAKGPSAADPVSDAYVTEHCPRLAAAAPYFKPAFWDSTFALGLESLLAAIRAGSAAHTSPLGQNSAPKPVIHPKR